MPEDHPEPAEESPFQSFLEAEAYLEAAIVLAAASRRIPKKPEQTVKELEEQALAEVENNTESRATDVARRNIGRIAALRDFGKID